MGRLYIPHLGCNQPASGTFYRAASSLIWILLAARLGIGCLEEAAAFLAWRLWTRRETVAEFVKVLRENRLPQRHYAAEELQSYVGNVYGNDSLTFDQRVSALMIQSAVAAAATHGIFASMRLQYAAEEALRIYSPGWKTPEPEDDDAL